MILDFLFKKTETDELRVIRFADIMTSHADHLGELNKDWLSQMATFDQDKMPTDLLRLRQEVTMLHPIIDGNLDPYKNGFTKYYNNIKEHLLNNEYIDEPKPGKQEWILNEEGKKMKKFKGHNKYQNYLDKKQKAEIAELNGKIHWFRRAIIVAIFSVLIGYGLRYLTEPKEKKLEDQSSTVEKSLLTPATKPEKNDSTNQ